MLKSITLLPERVPPGDAYPFSVPAIQQLSVNPVSLRNRVCFFTGENGSGKSTLLEAIAANYGFSSLGGSRNFRFQEEREQTDTTALARALELSFTIRTGDGFFLRAESFFNLAHTMDELGAGRAARRPEALALGGRGFHGLSHGESFLALLETRMRENGLFLLDEPEAALSPQRQLSMLVLMHDVIRSNGSASSSSAPTPPSCSAFRKRRSSPSTTGHPRNQLRRLPIRANPAPLHHPPPTLPERTLPARLGALNTALPM